MRVFFKLIFLLIVLTPLALGGLLYLAIETEPTVASRNAEITPASIERAKRIIEQNDPRKLKSGERRTISTSAADLDLAANYLAHQYGRGSARVRLQSGTVQAGASLRLPLIPTGLYLNVEASLAESESLARLDSLRVGKVAVPVWLAHWAIPRILPLLAQDFDFHAFINAVKKVDVSEAKLAVTYEWQVELADQLRAVLIPPQERERLRVYQDRLVEVSQSLPAKNLSITELLIPLFKLAAERSGGKPRRAFGINHLYRRQKL